MGQVSGPHEGLSSGINWEWREAGDRFFEVTLRRLDHVGVVVEDLAAAIEFFSELGLALEGEATVEGDWVDRVVGLDDVRAGIAMMQTPDGGVRIELSQFHSPSHQGDDRREPPNAPGIRHLSFLVEDIDGVVARLQARGAEPVSDIERYRDIYRLCYLRGPAGILVELAEEIAEPGADPNGG